MASSTAVSIALEHVIDANGVDADLVITIQVPNNADLSQVIAPTQRENLLFDPRWGPQSNLVRTGLAVDEPILTSLGVIPSPTTEGDEPHISRSFIPLETILGDWIEYLESRW